MNTYLYAGVNPVMYYDPYGFNRVTILKEAVKKAHEAVGGKIPKNKTAETKGKFGSPQRGDSKKGYRYDKEGHPNSDKFGEQGPHVNILDYTNVTVPDPFSLSAVVGCHEGVLPCEFCRFLEYYHPCDNARFIRENIKDLAI